MSVKMGHSNQDYVIATQVQLFEAHQVNTEQLEHKFDTTEIIPPH